MLFQLYTVASLVTSGSFFFSILKTGITDEIQSLLVIYANTFRKIGKVSIRVRVLYVKTSLFKKINLLYWDIIYIPQ